jgi:hypothetical protein
LALNGVAGRRSKTPTWAIAATHHVGLCEYRPARRHVSHISNFSVPDQECAKTLRTKIQQAHAHADFLESVYGVGHWFDSPE